MRTVFYLCGLLHPTHNSRLTMRETQDKHQWRDVLQNTWPVPFKTVMSPKARKCERNCDNPEEPKDTRWHDVMWFVGGTLEQSKDTSKKERSANDLRTLVNIVIHQCWLPNCDKCIRVVQDVSSRGEKVQDAWECSLFSSKISCVSNTIK